MAKKNTVKAKRGAQEREFSKDQWESMKKSGNTYGWVLASEIPDDVKSAESQIEASQVKKLTDEIEAQQKVLASKEEDIRQLQKRVNELETRFADYMKNDALLDGNNDEVAKTVETITDLTVLASLLELEKGGQDRKGAKEAIEKRIAALTPQDNPKKD